MGWLLDDAIRKAEDRYGTLTQSEYDELLKNAKVVSSDGKRAAAALSTAINNGGKAFRNVRRDESTENRYASSGGGCYLTTACLEVQQEVFDDNGYELTTLRQFRDTYVKKYASASIDYYYQIAPKIVQAINAQKDKLDIYKDIYQQLVLKTVELIESKEYDQAYECYKSYSLKLEKDYLSDNSQL